MWSANIIGYARTGPLSWARKAHLNKDWRDPEVNSKHTMNTIWKQKEDVSCKQGSWRNVVCVFQKSFSRENGLDFRFYESKQTTKLKDPNCTVIIEKASVETEFKFWYRRQSIEELHAHTKSPTHPYPDPRLSWWDKTKLYRCARLKRLSLTGWAIIVRVSCRKASPKGRRNNWNSFWSSFCSPKGLR